MLGAGHADLLGHSGGDLGVATDAFFDPTTGAGFVVYTNGDWDCATCAFSLHGQHRGAHTAHV